MSIHIPFQDTVYTVRISERDSDLHGHVVTVNSNEGREDDWGLFLDDGRLAVAYSRPESKTPWKLVWERLKKA